MRILLVTHLFWPSLGGLESMSRLLAEEFVRRGHRVVVVTRTAPSADTPDAFPFELLRRPSPLRLLRAVVDCDLCFHNNICLGFAWPVLLVRRPWIITHQTWIARNDGSLGWRERLKFLLLRAARSIAISRAVAAHLPVSAALVPNAYDADVFHPPAPDLARPRDLAFAGRLVSAKGADLLLAALALLARRNLHPTLTVIGDGPELARLRARAAEEGLAARVDFAGPLAAPALAATLGRHRVLIVPSRWAEPFGIVALEGAACGCEIIGSAAGGLAEAVGPCGHTFPNGDAAALARLIARVLRRETPPPDADARRAHLARHGRSAIADAYLALFATVADPRSP
jgi:glycogen synthase